MCFAPQRRALFRHRNFQKWSECGVFLALLLTNLLRATTACTFSTSQLPKAVRACGVFWLFYLQMCFASQRRALFRHLNFQKWSEPGVLCTFWLRNVLRTTTACDFSFLIWPDGSAPAALARLLFDPLEPQIIGKTQWILHLLSSHFFSSLIFSLLFFSSLTLPTSAFPSLHIVGSSTSKLPSTRKRRKSWQQKKPQKVDRFAHATPTCTASAFLANTSLSFPAKAASHNFHKGRKLSWSSPHPPPSPSSSSSSLLVLAGEQYILDPSQLSEQDLWGVHVPFVCG